MLYQHIKSIYYVTETVVTNGTLLTMSVCYNVYTLQCTVCKVATGGRVATVAGKLQCAEKTLCVK